MTSPVEGAGEEYGNYQKYETGKNKVEQVNDKGYDDCGWDQLKSNVRRMMESMNSPDS